MLGEGGAERGRARPGLREVEGEAGRGKRREGSSALGLSLGGSEVRGRRAAWPPVRSRARRTGRGSEGLCGAAWAAAEGEEAPGSGGRLGAGPGACGSPLHAIARGRPAHGKSPRPAGRTAGGAPLRRTRRRGLSLGAAG